MSTSIVGKPHIDTLVSGLALCELLDTDLDTAGARLWGTNVAGVHACYPTDPLDELPGPVPFTDPATYQYQDPDSDLIEGMRRRHPAAILQLLKAIRCWEYQSDNDPTLYDSWAWARLEELCAILYAMLGVEDMQEIDRHPQYKPMYDRCTWGV